MADANEKTELVNDTILVAYVTVHLESGESFELLPFEDVLDVKSKVKDLIKSWAQSGFLVRGGDIYPWHRVRRIQATTVEEISLNDAKLRREEWDARETARLQHNFWKTKRAREEKQGGEEKNGGESEKKSDGDSPRMAA